MIEAPAFHTFAVIGQCKKGDMMRTSILVVVLVVTGCAHERASRYVRTLEWSVVHYQEGDGSALRHVLVDLSQEQNGGTVPLGSEVGWQCKYGEMQLERVNLAEHDGDWWNDKVRVSQDGQIVAEGGRPLAETDAKKKMVEYEQRSLSCSPDAWASSVGARVRCYKDIKVESGPLRGIIETAESASLMLASGESSVEVTLECWSKDLKRVPALHD